MPAKQSSRKGSRSRVAAADHQYAAEKLPVWESEKALTLRRASMSQGPQPVKFKAAADALGSTIIVGIEIFPDLVGFYAMENLSVKSPIWREEKAWFRKRQENIACWVSSDEQTRRLLPRGIKIGTIQPPLKYTF